MVSSIGRTPRPRLTIEPPRQMAERLQRQLKKLSPDIWAKIKNEAKDKGVDISEIVEGE